MRVSASRASELSGAFASLSSLQTENAARQIDALRMIKSKEEIAVMREAASLADWVQALPENIRPGRLVGELDAAMTALGYQEAMRRFPEADVTIPCWTLSGPISASPHGAAPRSVTYPEHGSRRSRPHQQCLSLDRRRSDRERENLDLRQAFQAPDRIV